MVAGSQIMQTADGQTVICQPSAGQDIPAPQPQVIQIGGQGEASESQLLLVCCRQFACNDQDCLLVFRAEKMIISKCIFFLRHFTKKYVSL